jgi:hypothetical protein
MDGEAARCGLGDRDHADEARWPWRPNVAQFVQELAAAVGIGSARAGVAGRVEAWCAVEGVNFKTGVVGYGGQTAGSGKGGGLEARVLGEGGAGFGHFEREAEVSREDELMSRDASQERKKVTALARVLGGDEERHGEAERRWL